MNAIKLNFINNSNDTNNSDIVIFQKNLALKTTHSAIAWTVIENCGPSENHPFSFPLDIQVASGDSDGNYTPKLDAQPGQSFEMIRTASGESFQISKESSSTPTTIEIKNNLETGAINANIFKDGKLLASTHTIAPSQLAVFEFKPVIYIGVISEIKEGDVMNAAILSNINTELSLLGIASADIVMTGGGPGANATPFQFSLSNVKYV